MQYLKDFHYDFSHVMIAAAVGFRVALAITFSPRLEARTLSGLALLGTVAFHVTLSTSQANIFHAFPHGDLWQCLPNV